MENRYMKRYIANVVFEANSPLKVGSSDIDMLQDAPVQKDWNELPMILGTSIAGVLRKEFSDDLADKIFGTDCSRYKDKKEKQECLKKMEGSRIIISNALLCDEEMKVLEELKLNKSDFLKIFETLPIREHTAINTKGVANTNKNAKFDEEIVYKGSRFKFRLEFIADENDEQNWQELLHVMNSKVFRLGGGTTKGFGEIKILNEYSSYDVFELNSQEYQDKSSSLNTTYTKQFPIEAKDINYTLYTLKLKPDNFFMFGSGFGDDDADMTPVYEQVVNYKEGKLSEAQILIPASSVKGAIAHRTTYHYNLQNKLYIGNDNAKEKIVKIFGAAKDEEGESKGKILISDCIKPNETNSKVFDHVSIDRFTGGAIESALFNEKTIAKKDDEDEYIIEMLLHKDVQGKELEAFESSLKDITTGMLSLGGATTKGHGVFSGRVLKDGVAL